MTSNLRKIIARERRTDRGCESMYQELDAIKRDRFELLSAYLDGEVTADERRQVNRWLADDAHAQCLYQRLLRLRQGIGQLPIPTQDTCVEATIQTVFARIQRRLRIALMAGAGTVAVVCLGTVSGFFDDRPSVFRFAQVQSGTPVLEVALDEPVIEIPKTSVAPNSLKGKSSFDVQ
ncbi:MAG: transcriptional regulator [Cyanobacteria bacterium P01_A01_bin.123]